MLSLHLSFPLLTLVLLAGCFYCVVLLLQPVAVDIIMSTNCYKLLSINRSQCNAASLLAFEGTKHQTSSTK